MNNRKHASEQNDLNSLRQLLIGEIGAINNYENIINSLKKGEMSDLICGILDEEQEHYEVLLDLVRLIDKVQNQKYKKILNENIRIDKNLPQTTQTLTIDSNIIRGLIQNELNAINSYETEMKIILNSKIKMILYNIVSDHKKHIEILNTIIN